MRSVIMTVRGYGRFVVGSNVNVVVNGQVVDGVVVGANKVRVNVPVGVPVPSVVDQVKVDNKVVEVVGVELVEGAEAQSNVVGTVA